MSKSFSFVLATEATFILKQLNNLITEISLGYLNFHIRHLEVYENI